MIYFDNAATTYFKPQCVIDAVSQCLTEFSLNPNRGGSSKGLELEQKILATRKAVCALVNNDVETNVVFSQNCTSALNLAILGSVKKGGHAICTVCEHNSVLRPLMQLKSRGFVEVTVVEPDEDGKIPTVKFAQALRHNTYMIVLNHVSNVTGQCQNVMEIVTTIKKIRPDILVVLDGAQSVGYVPIDMKAWQVDMLAFPAHKGLHGIQGAGVLVLNGKARPKPIVFGGTGTESQNLLQPSTVPDGLEAGTLNCPAIVGLNAALDFWAENYQQSRKNIDMLVQVLLSGLNSIGGVKVYSQKNASGIVCFNVASLDSSQVADTLNQNDIAVRAGLHCAPLMHKWMGTISTGAVRASVALDNTIDQCHTFLNVIEDMAKQIR